MMRFAWSTAVKDWRRHRRDPIGLLMWIGIPILVGGLIIMASGGRSGPNPKAHVLVADEDDSFISGFLTGTLGQDQMGGLIETEAVNRQDGMERMGKGEATALLIIPEGFGQAVLDEVPTSLELLTNPSQSVLPGIVEEMLSMLVDATFYLHRLVGEDIKAIVQESDDGSLIESQTQMSQLGATISDIQTRISPYLFPPVIQVEDYVEAQADDSEDDFNIALIFAPSILFMSLLFMAQGLSLDLWHERDEKTLRRVVASPQTVITFLWGKVLAAVGVIFVVTFTASLAGYSYFGLSFASMPLALLWTLFSGVFLLLLMMAIQVHSPTQRAGGIFTMALMFPLMMIGGSFFPFEAMPAGMAFVGKMTPNGWALEQLKRILLDKVEMSSLAMSFIGLLVIGTLLFVLTARRIKSVFVQG